MKNDKTALPAGISSDLLFYGPDIMMATAVTQ